MQFEELINHYHIPALLGEGVAFWTLDSDRCLRADAPLIEAHAMLLMMDGQLTVSLNGRTTVLSRGMFADVMDARQGLRLLSASADVQAFILLCTSQFLDGFFKHKPPFTDAYVTKIKLEPVSLIEEGETARLIRCMDDIGQTICDATHHFQSDMLRCRIWIFFMETSDIFIRKEQAVHKHLTLRQASLFERFLGLLSEHIHREHTVQYYASQLCVSTQYLGRIVREKTDKTATQFVDMELYREVSRLLLETELSMQEIAEEMGFSDQAVMTKFFKRYTGRTPLQYRNDSKRF